MLGLKFIETQIKKKYEAHEEINIVFEKHLQTNLEKMIGIDGKHILTFIHKNIEHKLEKVRTQSYEVFSYFVALYLLYEYNYSLSKGIKEISTLHSEIMRTLDSLKPLQIQKIEQIGAGYITEYKQVLEKARSFAAEVSQTALTKAEPMSEETKTKWESHMTYFSIDIVECIASNNWVNRSRALSKFKEEVENIVEVIDDRKQNINKAHITLKEGTPHIVFFFIEALKEPVMKNYMDAIEILKGVIMCYCKSVLEAELKLLVTGIFPLIIAKLGDLKEKVKEITLQIMIYFATQSCLGPEFVITQLLGYIASKDMKEKNYIRIAGGLLQIMSQLQATYNVSKISEPILSGMLTFIKTILEHGMAPQKTLANTLANVLKSEHPDATQVLEDISPHKQKKEALLNPNKNSYMNEAAQTLMKSADSNEQIEAISMAKKCLMDKLKESALDEAVASEIIQETLSIVQYFIEIDCTQAMMEALKLLELSIMQCLCKLSNKSMQECLKSILDSLIIKTLSKNIRIQLQSDKYILKLAAFDIIGPSLLSGMVLKMIDQYVLPKEMTSMSSSYSKFPSPEDDKNSFSLANKILGLLKQLVMQCAAHLSIKKDFIAQLLDTTSILYKLHSGKPSFKQLLVDITKPLYELDNTYIDQYIPSCDFTKRLLLREFISLIRKDDADNVMMDPKTLQHTKQSPLKAPSPPPKEIEKDKESATKPKLVFASTAGEIGFNRNSSVDSLQHQTESEYKKLPSLEKRSLKKKASASNIQKLPELNAHHVDLQINATKLPALPKPVQFVVPKELEKKMVVSSVGFDKEKAQKAMMHSMISFKDDALEKEINQKFN